MSVFVDTNVLVYARDARDPEKWQRARTWMAYLWSSREGRLSAQVLNEYYVTVTGKLVPGLRPAQARADVARLLTWSPLPVYATLIDDAFEIGEDGSLSHWDALIVAAAQRAGCEFLLTEDLADGRTIDSLTVINPFTHDPPVAGEQSTGNG